MSRGRSCKNPPEAFWPLSPHSDVLWGAGWLRFIGSQDCGVTWTRSPRNLYSAQSRVSGEAGPGSCSWVILHAALGIDSSPPHQRNWVRGRCEDLWDLPAATLLYFSLNSVLMLDLLLLDLSSLFKSWTSATQTSTAFPLSACDCNYSSWPKQTAGSNPILNPFVFLKSLCSVETAKGEIY